MRAYAFIAIDRYYPGINVITRLRCYDAAMLFFATPYDIDAAEFDAFFRLPLLPLRR